jgi:cytochrome c553
MKLRLCLVAAAAVAAAMEFTVPHSWTDKELVGFRTPLAGLNKPPEMLPEAAYYALPENNLKTYPVYTVDKEPPNYLDWLKQQDPKPLVEVEKLHTEADWIAAGKEVFFGRELPRFSGSEDNLQIIRNPKIMAAYRVQTTAEGLVIGLRYVVREKGKVELGTDTCSMCHAQIHDGKLYAGLANNYTPFGPLMADLTRRYAQISPQLFDNRRRNHMREDYRVPYLADDPNLAVCDLPADQIADLYAKVPLGVYPRNNTSLLYPVKIANLVGVTGYQYFDRTGTARQRDITDLMRYSGEIGDVSDALTNYGDGPNAHSVLENMGLKNGIHRTPDALLYALALYMKSLQAPPNPNPFDAEARRGQKIFMKSANCAQCHTPPFYSNNKLTLAEGFTPSPEELKDYDIMNLSVGTDPGLALKTRKGTGFYRVPSLKMIWTNNVFLHDGSVSSLEEMFNPARLTRVKGHPFGLNLNESDRKALIKFLKTL